jgi:hypothetical protein
MIGLLVMAAAAATSFTCQIERQIVVNRAPGKDWGVGADALADKDQSNFRFILVRKGEQNVEIKADPDIMNIAGKTVGLPIAPGQFAFAIPQQGCTFTEQACLALVELSEMGDGKASVTVTVAGSSKTDGRETRNHFQLMFLGSCTAGEGNKPQ